MWKKVYCGEGWKGPCGRLGETALTFELHKVDPFTMVCFPLLVGLMLCLQPESLPRRKQSEVLHPELRNKMLKTVSKPKSFQC